MYIINDDPLSGLYYKQFHTMKILTRLSFMDLLSFCPLNPGPTLKAMPDIEMGKALSDIADEKPNTSINVAIQTQEYEQINNEMSLSESKCNTAKTVVIIERSKSSDELANAFLECGIEYFNNKNLKEATKHFQMCLKTFNLYRNHQHYRNSIFQAHSYLGFCYLKMKDHEKALEQLKVALAVYGESHDFNDSVQLLVPRVESDIAECQEALRKETIMNLSGANEE